MRQQALDGRRMKNLLTDFPTDLPEELCETLFEGSSFRIERIVSHGHVSPKDFWYDQEHDEWVVVLRGRARLRFLDQEESLEMEPRAWVNIPAHRRHRVEWTEPDETTDRKSV